MQEYNVPQASSLPTLATLSTEYLRGPDLGGGVGGMVCSIRDGNRIYSHSNHRGDVIARTDGSGSLTWYAVYEAYGTRPFEWSDGTTGNPDRQMANTKEEEAELGLLNEGMRYRDLETGTFLTRDPIRYADGPNMYCYVHCNPITHFDPLGLKMWLLTHTATPATEEENATVGHVMLMVQNYDDDGEALDTAALYELTPVKTPKRINALSDVDPEYGFWESLEAPTDDNLNSSKFFSDFDGIIELPTDQSMDQSARAILDKQRKDQIPYNAGYNNCADYVTSGVEAAYGGSLDLDDEEVVRYVLQNVSVSTVNEQFNSLRTVDEATVLKDPGELKSVYETMTGKKNPEPVEPMEVPSGIITDGIQQTGGY